MLNSQRVEIRRGYGTLKAIQAAFGNADFSWFDALMSSEADAKDAEAFFLARKMMKD